MTERFIAPQYPTPPPLPFPPRNFTAEDSTPSTWKIPQNHCNKGSPVKLNKDTIRGRKGPGVLLLLSPPCRPSLPLPTITTPSQISGALPITAPKVRNLEWLPIASGFVRWPLLLLFSQPACPTALPCIACWVMLPALLACLLTSSPVSASSHYTCTPSLIIIKMIIIDLITIFGCIFHTFIDDVDLGLSLRAGSGFHWFAHPCLLLHSWNATYPCSPAVLRLYARQKKSAPFSWCLFSFWWMCCDAVDHFVVLLLGFILKKRLVNSDFKWLSSSVFMLLCLVSIKYINLALVSLERISAPTSFFIYYEWYQFFYLVMI